MSKFIDVLNAVNAGRAGNNKGIPIPFQRLQQYFPNIQKGIYHLIGAETKCGKTSFTDDLFLFGALDYRLSNPDNFELDIDYFSFEINSQSKYTKMISRQIWHDFGMIVDVNTILSKGKNYCSDELYEIVTSYASFFEKIEKYLTVHEEVENPTGIWYYLIEKAKKKGTIIQKEVGKDPNGKPIMRFDKYVPNNPNLHWLVIIDHVALLGSERGYNLKQTIDKLSQYMVALRNNYGLTPIIIQQLTFDVDNDERFKTNRLTPTLRDFGDSKYTTRDAELIMTLFSPYRRGLTQFEGYDITKLGNKFRSLEILENRFGEPNINIGLNFIDAAGTFRELPKAKEMTNPMYDYAYNMRNDKSKYVKEAGIWKVRT